MGEHPHLLAWAIDAVWTLWLVIWIVLARGVKKPVREEGMSSRARHLVPLFIAAWLLFIDDRAAGSLLGEAVAPREPWMAQVGLALLLAGLLFALWARRTIGTNWSGTVTVKESHELVQAGPYALARHPIYTGLLLGFLGTAIAIDAWRGVLALVLATAAFLRKMRTEEAFMVDTFGDEYVAYRARTAALVPWLW
jgi:protein-S-isoprenylcysteine O-methyltransferase Ste14